MRSASIAGRSHRGDRA